MYLVFKYICKKYLVFKYILSMYLVFKYKKVFSAQLWPVHCFCEFLKRTQTFYLREMFIYRGFCDNFSSLGYMINDNFIPALDKRRKIKSKLAVKNYLTMIKAINYKFLHWADILKRKPYKLSFHIENYSPIIILLNHSSPAAFD